MKMIPLITSKAELANTFSFLKYHLFNPLVLKSGILSILLLSGFNYSAQAQCTGTFTIFTEDFEDHGNTANGGAGRYSSMNDFMDIETDDDYWGRIQASDQQYFLTNSGSGAIIHSNVVFTGQNGNFYYAGEDLDDAEGTLGNPDGNDIKSVSFTNINIDGATNMCFSGLFAAGENDGCGSSVYDNDDYMKVFYSIDGGPEVEALCFNPDLECNIPGDVTNEPLHHDPNCDGDGDEGAILTAAFSPYTFNIAGTGTSMNLRVEVHMDAGSEEVAIDYLRIVSDTDVVSCTSTASFDAPADQCVDAGASEYSGGLPVPNAGQSGVYSGPGVTDNGNGMTYTFDPAVAGPGTHIITYTFNEGNNCPDVTATDQIEVFPLPSLTFTQLPDFCIDDVTVPFSDLASPQGGIYSGPAVTDFGDGTTFSFVPSTAGVGMHEISYTYTDPNGCTASTSISINVFDLPTVTFDDLPDFCVNDGEQANLGVVTPQGGVFQGPGVVDSGNGTDFFFNPSAAGVGITQVIYTYTDGNGCSSSVTVELEVFDIPAVSITLPDTIFVSNGVPPQNVAGGGLPVGGVYTDAFGEIMDDGNGETFSFLNNLIVDADNTITYTFTDSNGCSNTASQTIYVAEEPVSTEDLNQPKITVFPNPTSGLLEISGAPIDIIEVVSISGKALMTINNPNDQIDISKLAAGIYWLKMQTDDAVQVKRIVKQ